MLNPAVSSQVVNQPGQTPDHAQSRKSADNSMHRRRDHMVPDCASPSESMGLTDIGKSMEAVDCLENTE